ncbi:MAG: acyl carrier protein [Sphingomonadales bacterium]|uniref:acyl carrier protein n=1 Tax=Sphingorhabdus sp. TaxID=1902408 RepID=UPI003BAF1440|nr:acyl carrier protein [Sphingomonadales bacterium]MBK9431496.1 acyl carrier protein [Sphingomonadales bacterium]MBL0023137.1 acyl carrier protein [Sphingomonadales bacterium]
MNQSEIIANMAEIFDEVFEYEGALSAETTSADVEEWDSLGHIRLVLAVENKFGIRFQPSEVVGLKNLGELADLVAQKAG